MEIKMCRFQRSDCLEWLQFVLEVALAQARLCEVHKRWKPGEKIQQLQDETWWVTQHHSLCCCYTAAETQVQEEQIGHKNVSCIQDRAGRVRNWWLVRTHWISIPLRRGWSWNCWAHRKGSTQRWSPAPAWLEHEFWGTTAAVEPTPFQKLGYNRSRSKWTALLLLRAVITHIVHTFHYVIHALRTLIF